MLDYVGYLFGLLLIFWFFYDDIFDFFMLKYSEYKRVPISKEYKIEKINLYQDRRVIKVLNFLHKYDYYKKKFPGIDYVEIVYTYYGKRYSVAYNKNYNFPPYPDDLRLPIGYKFEFLNCTLENGDDITLRMNELLGPMRNFYKDVGIEIPVSFITDGKIECLDNNLNGFILDDKLDIK